MSDNGDDILCISSDEGFGLMVFLHERVEDWDGVFAVGTDEECDGDEETEGVVGELLLDETESRRGEGWEGDAGYQASWGAFPGALSWG